MAYGPGLWAYFGLTVLSVWDLDVMAFHRCVTYIDEQERQAADGH